MVVGDSIPFNSPDDCAGCTAFVDRYATQLEGATGHTVTVQNLSEHSGLQIDDLVQELETDELRRGALASADIILVSIGFNDIAWIRLDDSCDGPAPETEPMDWSKYNAACGAASAEPFRPKLEKIYADIVAMRAGEPTVFLTTNRYNDAIGAMWSQGEVDGTGPSQAVVEAWNAMTSEAATAGGFVVADIYHAMNGVDGLTPLGDLVVSDESHPSDKGNEVIADTLADLGYAPLVP